MERVQIYKKQKGLVLFMTIFGLLSFVLGSILLIKSLKYGFKTEFPGGDWNYIVYIVQGIIFYIWGHTLKRNEKYYIEWDEKKLRYFLPKNKNVETIILSEISEISIELFEIRLKLRENEKILNLENVQFKELRRIKEKFEEIKLNTEKRKEI